MAKKNSISTTSDSLTVAANSGPTLIGIVAPTDTLYASSALVIKVTGLPNDGTVLLSDGVTPVFAGETLTVAQLTGLKFKPNAGTFNQSSTFSYTVSDPAGTTATGTAKLAIGRDTMPPTTTAATLTVAENAAATAIGIAAPSDPNYAAAQLSVTVTGLPSDGKVLLSDGVTVVTAGETLSVAQLTGLMFKPTTGASGQGSTLSYKVSDPAGLSATGTATLAIVADTMPPATTAATLTVAENATATAIRIVAPTDPNYSASQLSVTVTSLPSNGIVLLSDGVTQVGLGTLLTATQLTALLFHPTAGVFGQSSTFNYKVSDPAGLSTTGTATLAIGPDTMPPIATDPTLTVAPNSGTSPIGIPTPTDPNFAVSQLSATVTGLPSDGTVMLSDGVTVVTAGETLSVAQLTGLMFKPTPALSGQSSRFTYKVTNPAGLSANGAEVLAIAAASSSSGGISPDGMILMAGSTGSLVTAAGTWTFNTPATSGGYLILLNGNQAGASPTLELAVTNHGNLYAYNGGTSWYQWMNSSWAAITYNPTLTTTSSYIIVPANATATPLQIAAPIDLQYSAAQLTVTVTSLPNDGIVSLSDGVTSVNIGESLTVTQLTGLMFTPSANSSGESSTFMYTVTDPGGLTSSGNEVIATSASTGSNPLSPDGAVLLAGVSGSLVGNAGTWTFNTPSPTGGYSIVLNGGQVGGSPTLELEIANQGNVYAYNNGGLWYEWVNGAWAGVPSPATNLVTTATSPSTVSTAPSSPGNIDKAPTLSSPSLAGDLVGVRLQNTGTAAENAGYVTFGQVFEAGAVQPGDSLVARINGVNYAVQMDVKSTNADGSVRQAVLTLDAPSIAAGGTLDLMLAKGTATSPSPVAPSAAALLASSYDTTVNFTFHNANGTTTTDSASAHAALQAAVNAGTVQTWLNGSGVTQYDVVTTVDGGKLKVEFDISAYADGTTKTDVIFDNSWMFSPGKTDLNYDVSISQGGQQVYGATSVNQYLYSLWDHEVDSAGTISPNVQYDVAYLEQTGAVPAYDTSIGAADSAVQKNFAGLNASNTGPMGTGEVTTYMPTTGGRDDIGPQPNWVAQWLVSQNSTAQQVMMANADASGSVPWHFTDESTREAVNLQTYPTFWDDSTGTFVPANGWPSYAPGGSAPSADGDPWQPDPAHMPDLNYIAYVTSGSHYQLELLQAEADYALAAANSPGYGSDYTWTLPATTSQSVVGAANQQRAIAWNIREVAEAAYATPDSDPLKSYFVSELTANMDSLVRQYITNGADAAYGQLTGFIQGSGYHAIAPWQQGYIVTALADVAAMNIPQASADAVAMLNYMNNFVSGLFTNGNNGYAPLDGAGYWLATNDPTTGAAYTTWAQFYQGNVAAGNITPQTTVIANSPTDTQGGYPVIARAALADLVTYTQSPQAIQAYGYVASQIALAFSLGGRSELAAYQADPLWSEMPKLPDGTWLTMSQMQIDTSGAASVTLTAAGGDSLLSVVGSGNAVLNGGNGSCDLLYGGSGPTTLNAGTGNDYLFGGSGATTFNDNTGNNYMQGGSGGNTYVFRENHSGHDTIANFNPASDHLQIGANLNGNNVATASQLIAGATVNNGNTMLHLSPNDDVTLLGISTPSTLVNSIFVS